MQLHESVRFVLRFDTPVVSPEGEVYSALVYASERSDHGWDAWIVFLPVAGGRALPTDRETTQPNLAAVSYWGTGLSHVYLEGALSRALALTPEATLQRRAISKAREEALARAEAETYERAAAQAREIADRAAEEKEDARRLRASLERNVTR